MKALQAAQEGRGQGLLDLGGAAIASGAATPRVVVDDVPPATVNLAAKFENNPDYAKLMAEWEEKAKVNSGGRVSSNAPLGAMKSLGQAMVASWKRELAAQEEQEAQGATLASDAYGGDMMPVDEAAFLEAAE